MKTGSRDSGSMIGSTGVTQGFSSGDDVSGVRDEDWVDGIEFSGRSDMIVEKMLEIGESSKHVLAIPYDPGSIKSSDRLVFNPRSLTPDGNDILRHTYDIS
jgi:hypothetical protein